MPFYSFTKQLAMRVPQLRNGNKGAEKYRIFTPFRDCLRASDYPIDGLDIISDMLRVR